MISDGHWRFIVVVILSHAFRIGLPLPQRDFRQPVNPAP